MKVENKNVNGFNNDELLVLEKLGYRLRKGKVKVEKSVEELELIKRCLDSGLWVSKGGGDGSKKRLNSGVGNYIRGLMFEDEKMSNEKILELVCGSFGNDNSTLSCVRWYRNDLKNYKKGVDGYIKIKD